MFTEQLGPAPGPPLMLPDRSAPETRVRVSAATQRDQRGGVSRGSDDGCEDAGAGVRHRPRLGMRGTQRDVCGRLTFSMFVGACTLCPDRGETLQVFSEGSIKHTQLRPSVTHKGLRSSKPLNSISAAHASC